MIEEPSVGQRRASAIAASAHMYANGRAAESILCELQRRGFSSNEIEANWKEIMQSGQDLMRERRKRLCIIGTCWLLIGLVLLGGFAWALVRHGMLPWILLIGTVPAGYGCYLLCLPPTKEPDFESPRIFGKGL